MVANPLPGDALPLPRVLAWGEMKRQEGVRVRLCDNVDRNRNIFIFSLDLQEIVDYINRSRFFCDLFG